MYKKNFKILRDVINSCDEEQEKAHLQEQWSELHQQVEDEKALEDENWETWWKA